jgi:hypothetical protein
VALNNEESLNRPGPFVTRKPLETIEPNNERNLSDKEKSNDSAKPSAGPNVAFTNDESLNGSDNARDFELPKPKKEPTTGHEPTAPDSLNAIEFSTCPEKEP